MGHSTSSGRSGGGGESRKETANRMLSEGRLAQDTYGQLATDNFSDAGINKAVDRGWIDRDTANQLSGKRSSFEDEIDRAKFSGDGNVRTFQIPGIGAAQVRYGRDEQGNVGWTARVGTPNSDLNPINGNRRFDSREAAESRAREVLKNRVRSSRAESRRERAATEAQERRRRR